MSPRRLCDKERSLPLAYDPETSKFLYLSDVQTSVIVRPSQLDFETQKIITLKRLEMKEPFSIEMLGSSLGKEQQMEEIRKGTEIGKMVVRAEIAYLSDTIDAILRGDIM